MPTQLSMRRLFRKGYGKELAAREIGSVGCQTFAGAGGTINQHGTAMSNYLLNKLPNLRHGLALQGVMTLRIGTVVLVGP